MLISNYLNAEIGATFFIFGQLLRTFYPVFEQLFQHPLEQSIYPTGRVHPLLKKILDPPLRNPPFQQLGPVLHMNLIH